MQRRLKILCARQVNFEFFIKSSRFAFISNCGHWLCSIFPYSRFTVMTPHVALKALQVLKGIYSLVISGPSGVLDAKLVSSRPAVQSPCITFLGVSHCCLGVGMTMLYPTLCKRWETSASSYMVCLQLKNQPSWSVTSLAQGRFCSRWCWINYSHS